MLLFFKTKLNNIIRKYGNKDIEKSQIPLFTHRCNEKYTSTDQILEKYKDANTYIIRNIFFKPIGMFIAQQKLYKLKLGYPIIRHFEIFKKYCNTSHHYGTRALRKIVKKYKKLILQANNGDLIQYYEKRGFTLYNKIGHIMTFHSNKIKQL